ncbi:MAG: ABC transporter permease [Oscillospiraceae bacterium]|nr:ABC transporter permease [Oscillospiraceae bacterium]
MLRPYLETFHRYRYLLICLVDRDYKVKYRRSVFGILWSMLNPIMMMIILNAVFSRVFRADIENFPVYLLTGQLVFSFFNEATSSAIFSVVEASALIKKIYVPKYVFPLERVLFGFVNMIFSLVALVLLMIIQKVKVTAVTLLFPLPLIALFLFTCGWSFLISALCVYFRDLKHLYSVLMTAWMYITPIMYPIEYLSGSWVYKIVMLNPLTWYVQYFRQVVMYNTLPTLEMNLVCFGEAIVMMLIGLLSFRKLQDKFILHI